MRSRPLVVAVSALAVLGLAVPLTVPSQAAPAGAGGLSARTAAQIEALAEAKNDLTPAQRKISAQLRAAAVQRSGGRVAAGVGTLATGIKVDAKGRTTVRVVGDAKGIAAAVAATGGAVLRSYRNDVDADVALSSLDRLAASSAVESISEPSGALLARAAAPAGTVTPHAGSVDSEGDVAMTVDKARATFKVKGAGITVGVLSDGVDSLAGSIASGDLPTDTTVLPGQEGSGDEGTAMLEIVHDLAPTAKLLFATAFTSDLSFADNIRALREAGADVIVDDVIYFNESPFQDGPIARAVIDVTADGALYFSSAGNEGNVTDGTSGNWEGAFVSSGQQIGTQAGVAHDFAPGAAVQSLEPISSDSAGTVVTLHWADPLGAASDDYDLYVVNSAGTVVAASNSVQDGNDNPYERVSVPSGTGLSLAVVKHSGANRYFQVSDLRGRFEAHNGLTAYVIPGVTRGHSAVPAAFSVAAVPAADPFPGEIAPGVTNPSGPFPGSYTRRQKTEVFTSDGPRRVFFTPNGTPITPGNFGNTGGAVRQKPDLTASDGVATTVPGFIPFYGTSAAAPHAAAVAALLLSGNPGITPAQVRTALTGNALDIEAAGVDRDTGAGIVMAKDLLTATGATPQPYLTVGDATLSTTTDGDKFLEPGEIGSVLVPVTNGGDALATNVVVALASGTSGVTVTPASRSYPPVGIGATKTGGVFKVKVRANVPAGTVINLNTTASWTGGLSPATRALTIVVGRPGPMKGFAYNGPAVAIPDNTAAGATATISVTGVGTLASARFSIDGTSCTATEGATTVGIDHTYDSDLIGTLATPDGTTVTVFNRVAGSGNNICKAVFDDAATRSIQDATSSDVPLVGTWRPTTPLSTVRGHSGNGSWSFTVIDNANADTGSIRAFSLHLRGYVG